MKIVYLHFRFCLYIPELDSLGVEDEVNAAGELYVAGRQLFSTARQGIVCMSY